MSDTTGKWTESDELLVEQEGHVLVITLNRPARKNALTPGMRDGLHRLIMKAATDDSVRCFLFTGAGDAFCAGADVGSLEKAIVSGEAQGRPHMPWTPLHCGVFKPSVVAVNGVCASGGLHFLSDCEIVIGSDTSSYLDTHVDVGQVTTMEAIGLARRMPLGPIMRMAILGRAERLNAAEALRVHLISEIVPQAQLMTRARELAQTIASHSPAAVQSSLRTIWRAYEPNLTRDNHDGYAAVLAHRDHPDAKEGPRAYLEKRPPRWA